MMKKNRIIVLVLLASISVYSTSCAQKNEFFENSNSDNPPKQLMCKLIGEEKAKKKEILKSEIFSQIKGLDEVENGYILKFDDKDDILLKLTDYLMIEKECCSFFTFDLNIQPNSKGISLRITGQDEAKDILKPLMDEVNIIK